jgi:glycosyltransferase involved in cell wall biosynthesis
VATRAGGIPEVVEHEVTGLLVPTRDPDALADAIVTLLEDSERRAAMAAAGRRRVVAEFSVDALVRRTLDVYERRLAARRR